MNSETIVRAWKDPAFRASLSAEQRASLASPAGTSFLEMDEAAVRDAVGGSTGATPPTVHQNPDCSFILTGCYSGSEW